MILNTICTSDIKTNVYLLYVLKKFWCKLPDDNAEQKNIQIAELSICCVLPKYELDTIPVERHTCSTIQERHLRQKNLLLYDMEK
jgi:hypothetical protein